MIKNLVHINQHVGYNMYLLNKTYIQHPRNEENQIQQYKVDGWDFQNTVYAFHVCFFHGCPKCFSSHSFNPLKNEIFEATFKKHNERYKAIKSSPE